MSFVFKFDTPLTGSTAPQSADQTTKRAKPYHKYIAVVEGIAREMVGSREYYVLKLSGVNYKSGDYDAFKCPTDADWASDWMKKIADALIASNEALKGAIGQNQADPSKWAGKKYQIGVIYKPSVRKNEQGAYVENGFTEPSRAISVHDVNDECTNTVEFERFKAQWWNKSGNGSAAQTAPVSESNTLPSNSDDLPF